MSTTELFALPAWTPLSRVGDAREVRRGLHHIGSDIYAMTSWHNRELRDADPEAPFVLGFVCALTPGSAARAAFEDASFDDAGPPVLAPAWLLTTLPDTTYARVAAVAESEKATYTASGTFANKILRVHGVDLYYRSTENDPEERAFALVRRLTVQKR